MMASIVLQLITSAWREIRAPYVFLIVLVVFCLVSYLLLHHDAGLEKTSYLAAMAVSALFCSRASIMMKSDAPNTALVTFVLGGIIMLIAIQATSVEVFKDMVVEGAVLQLVGQTGVFIEVTIERSNRLRGIILPKKE